MWNIYDGAVPSDAGQATPSLASVVDIFDGVEDDGPLAWQERALCAQTDPEAFFPEKGGSTREAKKVCASCEVRSECLDYALENDERFGIWGGLSERERRKLKRRAV
ncbi:WhiB family transcriptional regulator [Demequina sediminicola]|uniref:WhiB family transcriptional regulator n=1 Tax=Demequina sediminicola TaxID=1095026 RepID=UPI00078675C0|nr:WhiB family transcriptional regulator [Demequina sediminicola]